MAINFAEIWSTFDWIIIVAYFVAIISVGLVMRKRASKNMKSYLRGFKTAHHTCAGRRRGLPAGYDSWTIVGLAECGTTMGICMTIHLRNTNCYPEAAAGSVDTGLL